MLQLLKTYQDKSTSAADNSTYGTKRAAIQNYKEHATKAVERLRKEQLLFAFNHGLATAVKGANGKPELCWMGKQTIWEVSKIGIQEWLQKVFAPPHGEVVGPATTKVPGTTNDDFGVIRLLARMTLGNCAAESFCERVFKVSKDLVGLYNMSSSNETMSARTIIRMNMRSAVFKKKLGSARGGGRAGGADDAAEIVEVDSE